MRKQIKKYGNSLVIKITAEDQEVYELEEGDVIEMEIVKLKEDRRK